MYLEALLLESGRVQWKKGVFLIISPIWVAKVDWPWENDLRAPVKNHLIAARN